MDEQSLQSRLVDIQNGESSWQEQNVPKLVEAMLEHIGSPNPQLRDKLIYQGFDHLILKEALMTNETLVNLLTRALGDEFLFYEIGDVGTDHIFKRSFSVLLIALILKKDLEHSLIPSTLLDRIRNELLLYLDLEQDVRGFVPEKGWAHSIAHTADAIDELVKNPRLNAKYFPVIFQGLINKVFTFTDVYVAGEDERLLKPIMTMLDIGLPVETLDELFEKIPVYIKKQKVKLDEERFSKLYENCRNFLKSFYFYAGIDEKNAILQPKISDCLRQL